MRTFLALTLCFAACVPGTETVDPFANAVPLHTFRRLARWPDGTLSQLPVRSTRPPGPVVCTDTHLYVSTPNDLRIITVNSGADASESPYVFDPDRANDPSPLQALFLDGGRLIAVSLDEIIVFSLADPERPVELGRYDFRSSADTRYLPIASAALAGRSLFIVFTAPQGFSLLQMRRYDVSGDVPVRGEALRFKSVVGVPTVPSIVAGDERWLYAFAGGAMYTLDATIPGNLQPAGVAIMPAGKVTVMGTRLLVDRAELGYGVVDVSDPLTPTALVTQNDSPYTLEEYIMPGTRTDANQRYHAASWQHGQLLFSGYWTKGYPDGRIEPEVLVTTGAVDRDGVVQGRDAPLARIVSDPRVSHVCWNGKVLTLLGRGVEFWGP